MGLPVVVLLIPLLTVAVLVYVRTAGTKYLCERTGAIRFVFSVSLSFIFSQKKMLNVFFILFHNEGAEPSRTKSVRVERTYE